MFHGRDSTNNGTMRMHAINCIAIHMFMPFFSISSRVVERFRGNVVVLPGTAPRAGDVYHA
jgi:hypothetical protein